MLANNVATSGGVPMSPLAAKVPKPKASGNTALDSKLEIQREHLVDGINLLDHYADLRGDRVATMRRFVSERGQCSGGDEGTFSEVSTFGRLDEALCASVLTDSFGINADTVARCKNYDPDTLRHLMCYLHNIGPLTQVPSECRSKQVLYNVLKHRRAEVGDRVGLAN